MKTLKTVGLAVLMTIGVAGGASAEIFPGSYDFSGTQYADDFTDVRRGAQINVGYDRGKTGRMALNFTGRAGTAGDTWLTKWTPGGSPAVLNGECGTFVASEVLIHPFDNRKGAGLVALLNDANPGDKGLALILYDSGNSDVLQLATIDPFTGRLSALATMPFFLRPIKENTWYLLAMSAKVEEDWFNDTLTLDAKGFVYSMQDPEDPLSEIEFISGVHFRGPITPTGLQAQGQVGIIASAINAVVDSSVTEWLAGQGDEGPCEPD